MTLGCLFTKYGSDKDTHHSYGDFYDEILAPYRETATAVLEIGILGGGSLRAWRDWFAAAWVYGVDHHADLVDEHRVASFRADSTDPGQMAAVAPGVEFDVVVDDGCHWFPEQRATWENLWPRVKPGGVYVVEDVQNDNWIEEFRNLGFEIHDRRGVKYRADDVLAVMRKPVAADTPAG